MRSGQSPSGGLGQAEPPPPPPSNKQFTKKPRNGAEPLRGLLDGASLKDGVQGSDPAGDLLGGAPTKKLFNITGSGMLHPWGLELPEKINFSNIMGPGVQPPQQKISNISGCRAEPPTKIKFSCMMHDPVAPQDHRVRCRNPPKDGVQDTATARSWGGGATPPKKKI